MPEIKLKPCPFCGGETEIIEEVLMSDMGAARRCWVSCADCEKFNCLTGEIIDRQPTVDAEPVRHGKWLRDRTTNPTKLFSCSECKGLIALGAYAYKCYYDYCPNCGAKMDK